MITGTLELSVILNVEVENEAKLEEVKNYFIAKVKALDRNVESIEETDCDIEDSAE